MEDFAGWIAGRVAAVPGVEAVTLGGSRAQGTQRPGSDWDVGLYYRGRLDPADVRALGWEGQVFAPGAWGGGVMNGGAWLTVEGERVDLIYRDLDVVEHWTAEAEQGRYDVQRLLFYVAGIPTYVVAAELALSRVLHGALPRPAYPDALRRAAGTRWRDEADYTLDYAERAFGLRGDPVSTAALVTQALLQLAHARAAADGRWVLNEKRLIADAGLAGPAAEVLALLPAAPTGAIAAARGLLGVTRRV